MAVNPIPEGPRVTPILLYEDVAAAMDFLSKAFGFEEEGHRFTGPDGKVNHATMKVGDGTIMMGCPGPDYKSPKRFENATQILYVYVEDVDEHCAHAKEAGANILKEPEDQFYGDRRYAVTDPEGHQWYFASHVREVSEEEMATGG